MFKRLTCLLLAVLLMSFGIISALATTVTSGPLNIRQDATTESAVVGSLQEGTQITVLETKAVSGYTWGRILYDGNKTGWIRLDFTDFDVSAVQAVKIVSGPLNVRSQSSTDSEIVGSLQEGTIVTLMEIKTVGSYNWGRITLTGDVVGWIRLDFTNYGSNDPSDGEEPAPPPAPKGKWSLEGGKWYYYINGVKSVGWQLDNGKWYYMDANGVMQTGWVCLGGVWYYLQSSGAMVTGWQTVDGALYYFKAGGAMATGWQKIGDKHYYFGLGGKTAIGWQDISGKRYYFDANGAMATGKYRVDGVGYLFSSDGVLQGEAQFTSDDCLALLKLEEGFSFTPYWDYTQWTVGYGTQCPKDRLAYYQANGITEAEAEQLLRDYLATVEKDVDDFLSRYGLTLVQKEYDALVLFSYNVGTSWCWETTGVFHNAIKNRATGNELIRAFSIWNSAGGSFKDFLMRRRLSEANMYLNGVYSQEPPSNYCYVRYDANGGEVSPQSQGYDSNIAAEPMSTPTMDGRTFLGWYTAKTGGTKVTALDASHNGMMLYARWEDPNQGNQGEADRPIIVTVNTADVSLRKGHGTEYGRLDNKPYAQAGEKYSIVETFQGETLLWGRFTELGGGWICLAYTNYTEAYKLQSASNDWLQLDGKWYYYKGLYKQLGWLQLGNTWYYMGEDGAMVTGTVTIDGKNHKFHSSGAWLGEVVLSGWVQQGNSWYYYRDGVKATGWLQLGNTWYYMNDDGAMVTGTVTIDGKNHKFHSSGAWLGEVALSGWILEDGTWYYYRDGVKATGWIQSGSVWYYLDSSGAMKTGWLKLGDVWYYLQSSGAMKTGWLQLGSEWYYFEKSGAMVTGERTIGPATYRFDADGRWIP